ncbi:non-specific lipid transfer protein GPI-anchored 20 [Cornus florida]|uniref:non-specific lipid transfer protein GPI-anchored 20 n=1 Tax=Cornus florida TaxID=4283 RepID=UPI00289B5505|nr:non-specific lipid transfer protein GPI-anchored 20 [Cornus florida]
MEAFMPSCSRLVPCLVIALMASIMPVYGQTTSPCTTSMITSFTPCMNFVTNSSSNGTSPTPDCCNSLKALTSNGTDCLCLIATGSVPFQIPINRTLAISLPRACNMPGVPLQCKASAAPIPAPGPIALGPSISPGTSQSPTASTVPKPVSPALAPEANTTPDVTPTVGSEAPATNTGSRPVLTPSAAHTFSPSLLLALLGAVTLKHYY